MYNTIVKHRLKAQHEQIAAGVNEQPVEVCRSAN
jgi:hypothetical protein